MTFYGVYYYTPTNQTASVYLVGFYDTLETAKEVLSEIIPNYIKNYRNSVSGQGRIGWINRYEMNQPILNPEKLVCSQPHTSVNLFECV